VKQSSQVGLYLLVAHVYDGEADDFDPDRLVREAVVDGDLIAAATIALESYGWQLYAFIVRQVQVDEVDEVFTRVADEMLRGLPELIEHDRVRNWIYTLVHGAWVRTQAGDPCVPLASTPGFARWVQRVCAGYRSANGLGKVRRVASRIGSTSGGGQTLVVAGGGSVVAAPMRTAEGSGCLPRQNAITASTIRRAPRRVGMERLAMSRLR